MAPDVDVFGLLAREPSGPVGDVAKRQLDQLEARGGVALDRARIGKRNGDGVGKRGPVLLDQRRSSREETG